MCVEILDFGEHLAKTKQEKPVNANNKLKTDTQTLIISIIALSEEERNILANSVRLPHRESPNFTLKNLLRSIVLIFSSYFSYFLILIFPINPH